MENSENNFSIPEILESFRKFDGVYKRAQIDAALNLKEALTPHLIAVLESVLIDPEKYCTDENLYDHIYSVMLLGHFKETRAHQVIVDIFSLPGDLPYRMFGDITTQHLPVILLNTCGGSVELIKSLILNTEADEYCRVSACQALAYAVVEGHVSRDVVVEFFGGLFTGNEADEISDFWGLLATIVCNLCPEEIMGVIRQAYADELIMPGMIRYRDFEMALDLGKEKGLEKLALELERFSLDDIHGSMSWWACFGEDPDDFYLDRGNWDVPTYSQPPSGKSLKKKKTAKKKKRKQAKASKRKNRR